MKRSIVQMSVAIAFLSLVMAGCATTHAEKKTSLQAGETVSLIQSIQTDVGAAKETVTTMTPENLAATKPVALVHMDNAEAGLVAAGASAIKTQQAATKDEKVIANYESNDPMKTKLEWLAGICAVVGTIGIGLGFAGMLASISFLTGQVQKLCFAVGGASMAVAVVLGWIITHWSQIQTGLTWTIITGIVGIVIYVFVMHGSAKDGTWAFVAAIEAFFVGLVNNIKGMFKGAKAIATGVTGETTLIPPTYPISPPPPTTADVVGGDDSTN